VGVAAAALFWVAVSAAAGAGGGGTRDPLVQELAGATVDWRRGVIAAVAGAAPDLRMPSPEVARLGAERRARAAAVAHLDKALKALPLGGDRRLDDAERERALGRARSTSVELQSNGGAVVRVEVGFGDWLPTPAGPAAGSGGAGGAGASAGSAGAPVALVLPSARLGASPLVSAGGKQVALGGARYELRKRAGAAAKKALRCKVDRQGRILIESAPGGAPELAGRAAVIYVEKVLR
jgi:hypothetical protein